MAYQTPDSKKEEFRKYLEKSGVIDALTKVLVGLYEEPERPTNAIDYIKKFLGAPTGVDVEEVFLFFCSISMIFEVQDHDVKCLKSKN